MTENINDPETEKLLAEMQEQEVTRKQLERRADELGVKYQSNTGDDKLAKRIAEAEAAIQTPPTVTDEPDDTPPTVTDEPDDFTVKNVGVNPHRIGGKTLMKGESHTLTKPQLSDQRIMGRVEHALKLGILVRV